MSLIKRLCHDFEHGKITRREFIQRGLKMGLTATTLSFLMSHLDPQRMEVNAAERKLQIEPVMTIANTLYSNLNDVINCSDSYVNLYINNIKNIL